MKRLIFSIIVAACLWTVMFSPWTAPHIDFWLMMSCSAAVLGGLSSLFNPRWWKQYGWKPADAAYGIIIAAALWGIFWTGDRLSSLLFEFARPQVDSIYGMKSGISPWLLSALLLLLIGPAEEIFWREYVQRALSRKMGGNAGCAVAVILYTAVHIPSCNFMLVMASLVAGTVWGLLYRIVPSRFPAIIISHALWDAAVFVWFPI